MILLEAWSTGTTIYLSWRSDMWLATFESFKIDVERVLIDPLSFFVF